MVAVGWDVCAWVELGRGWEVVGGGAEVVACKGVGVGGDEGCEGC